MTPSNAIFNATAQTASTGSTTPPSSSSTPPSNVLGPNAFITLLTAQLQAQDPLNPMDPNQMVDELTSMNTLQQIIQMRQDLDTLVGAGQSAANGGSTGSNAAAAVGSAISQAANQAFSGLTPSAAAASYLHSASHSQFI
jgi:flagellar basal-body rod modification protein FlgD